MHFYLLLTQRFAELFSSKKTQRAPTTFFSQSRFQHGALIKLFSSFILLITSAFSTYANDWDLQVSSSAGTSTSDVVEPYANWHERGRLVSYKHLRTLSKRDIRYAMYDLPFSDSYAGFGLEDFFDFYNYSEIRAVTKYHVDVYQVIYETIDPWGVPTTASGAVLVPRSYSRYMPTPALLSLQRGTVFYDQDVPSTGNMPDWGIWRGLLPASAGYITAMPDLLGFGAAKHMVHTYLAAEPSARATIDMLRAVRQLAQAMNWPIRDEVFLTGLSQGGHATLATQREIEAHHLDEFKLAASAPASGPYFLSAVANSLFTSDTLIAPQVSSLLLLTYNDLYLQKPLSDFFQYPYNERVLDIHNKNNTNAEVIAELPAGSTTLLYTEEFLDLFRNQGEQDLKAAFTNNDMHAGWQPVAPIRFFHGENDSIVPLIQAQAAVAGLSHHSYTPELVVIEGAEHLQTIVPYTLLTIQWFNQILAEQ